MTGITRSRASQRFDELEAVFRGEVVALVARVVDFENQLPECGVVQLWRTAQALEPQPERRFDEASMKTIDCLNVRARSARRRTIASSP